MHAISRLFLLFLLFSACSNPETPEAPIPEQAETQIPEAPPSQSNQNIIAPALLTKTGIILSEITQQEFEELITLDADFRKSRTLCEQSKGYKADNWEGINDCSWAVEKERIKFHKALVSREGNQLMLKANGGTLNLEHALPAGTEPTYYQFKGHLSPSNYYLIEEIRKDQCNRSKLINAANSNQYNVKGSVQAMEDSYHFVAYNQASNTVSRCLDKLEFYKLGAEGLEKKWHLPLNNKSIAELKTKGNKQLYLSLQSKSKLKKEYNYLKLSWQ